jgi:hypothetical protein
MRFMSRANAISIRSGHLSERWASPLEDDGTALTSVRQRIVLSFG